MKSQHTTRQFQATNRPFPVGSTVKVDIGVQVDGYVTDTAFTAPFSPEGRSMTTTAELALKTAIDNIHGDMALGEIGALSGNNHKKPRIQTDQQPHWASALARYLIHAGTSIPNVSGFNPHKVETGGVYAVEPFVTLPDAIGMSR